jgi:NADH:ubiquinone oxidoreductase subunit 3 (subunit A)
MNRNILIRGIEVIGILFAAFGGFLAGIAPPQAADAKYAVGISSFLALIILLTAATLSKKKYQKAWIIAAIALFIAAIGAAYYYKITYDALTFEYPPGSTQVEHITGTELTPRAKDYKQKNNGISNAQLLARFGGLENKGKVWTEESVNSARTKLIASYVVLVLAIAAAIFALTEGALSWSIRYKRSSRNNLPTL